MPEAAFATSPSITVSPVIIDGCALPRILYNLIKATARATGKIQCVGVICEAPDAPPLPPADFANPSSLFDVVAAALQPSVFTHLRTGEHCIYIVDQTSAELHARHDLAMILYISPHGE